MKTLAKATLCAFYKYSGLLRLQEALVTPTFLTVLVLHRVTDDVPEDGLTVNTRRFRRICRMLSRDFNVVPLADIFHLRNVGGPFPRRTVAITFDDCYRDNLFAARVLANHRLPACFFIPTAYVGTEHVFPWDRGLKRMPNLSWDDVREMSALGHEIGSHTVTHPNMAEIALDEARFELAASKQVLEEQLGQSVRWFAYPFGGREHFRCDLLPLVTEAGYEGCVSCHGGLLDRESTELIVPREAVPDFRSVLNLEARLRGGLNWYYGMRQRHVPPRPALAQPR